MSSPLTHYQRLKVAPDAPPEVIRAAYRVLAARLHPDRHGGAKGPGDEVHAQMVALNAAYEVLIDPHARAGYDASLQPVAKEPDQDDEDEARQGPATRVDMDWLAPRVEEVPRWWPPSPRLALGGGVTLLLLGTLLGAWVWQVKTQSQMDRALSDHYLAQPAQPAQGYGDAAPVRAATATTTAAATSEAEPPPAVAPAQTAGATPAAPEVLAWRRAPTVEELSRMSDEELLKVLPLLDRPAGAPRTPAAVRAEAQHMLDGKPLRLRTEAHLVDPLAPELAASAP